MHSCRNLWKLSDQISEEEKRQRIFSVVVLAGIAIFWLICLFTRSANINSYFLKDHHDTGMDYFNMLECLNHDDPWYDYALYPAMCFAILRITFHAIPPSAYMYGIDSFMLRENMIAQLWYILILMICLVGIWELCQNMAVGTKFSRLMFAASLLFSGPMFYLLERGNLLVITLPFLLAFYALYDSSDKKLRYLGYLCLAVSASIKIYPALFGLLVPMKKRYRETIHLVLIGFVVFMLPFFWFRGLDSVRDMLYGSGVAANVLSNNGVGYNFSFHNTLTFLAAIIGKKITAWPAWSLIFPLALSLWIIIAGKREWQKLYGITLLCVWLPSFSFTYTLTMFFPAIISFFRDTKNTGKFSKVYTILLALLIIPYVTPLMPWIDDVYGGDVGFAASWTLVIVDGVMMIIGILILVEHYLIFSRRTCSKEC